MTPEQNELNAKILLNSMQIFVEENQSQNLIEELYKTLSENDYKKGYLMMHNLKGNAGQIGFTRLQAIAKEIEQALKIDKNPTPAQINALDAELKAALAEAVKKLS